MNESDSLVQISASGPPHKDYFKYYKELIINHDLVSGTGSHQNFPVLISLLDSDLKDGVQPTGNDIAFANDILWLDHEIELFDQTYNSTHAKLIAWIRIPELSTSEDTVIHLYYGNSTMGSRENPNGVWDKNFKGVWHLSESTGNAKDSTSYSTSGTLSGGVSQGVSGQIYDSYKFDGTESNVDFGDPIDEHLDIGTGSFTIGMWLKINSSTATWQVPITKGHPSGTGNDGYRFETQTSGQNIYFQIGNGSSYQSSYIESITFGTWIYFVGRVDRTSDRIYLFKNGAYSGYRDISGIGNINSSNPLTFSRTNTELNGCLDEVHISNISRSDGWIATEFENQNNPNSFYSVGKEKSVSGHPPNAHFFTYYKEFVIDHSMVSGSDDLLNFPVLISCYDEDLHDDVQSNGNDIAFSDGVDWLDHEIESFDQAYSATHAQLTAWVRIPKLSPSKDTIIRMYYGNSTMGSRENPASVWNSDYKGVWHLSEDPSGTIYDSTSNNHDGTAQGSMISGDQVDGQIDGSLDFEGNDEYIDFGNPTELQITGAITVEAWFNADYFGNTYLISKNGPSGQRCWDLSFDPINSTHGYAIYRYALNGYSHADDVGNVTVAIHQWYHIVGVYNPSTYSRFFINGQMADENVTDIVSSQYDAPNNLRFGARGDVPPPNYFDGTIDEVRISNIARSASWIETEYNNQYKPSNFYSIGKEYPVSGIPAYEQYFDYYKEIIIDNAMVSGSHELINFPLLISILDEDLYSKAQVDGDDIAFTYNGAWLDHEIEFFDNDYDGTHAKLIAWVSLPRLSTLENTVIRMYYGNSTMNSRQNPSEVWNTNYKGVWHLKEDPSNPAPQFSDSTAYSNEGTAVNLFSSNQSSGKIDGSLIFNDQNEACVNVSDDDSLDLDRDMTISAWVKTIDNEPDVDVVISKWSPTPGNRNYWLGKLNSNDFAFYVDSTQNVLMDLDLINDNNWHYVVGVADSTNSLLRIYLDGIQRNTAAYSGVSETGNHYLNIGRSSGSIEQEWNGKIDEVRVSSTAYSADWIVTEFTNQNDTQYFATIGGEVKFDTTPPTYSNLTESSDPLELGAIEVIQINVSDPSGINDVQIEFSGSNHSMTNIGGDIWQYNWTPSSTGNYSYTVWMEDNFNNWNSTMGTIVVIDTTAPTYSNLIESQDPLQLGKNETIEINVFDLSGVNQTLLEYESTNHSMVFQGGNKWSWSKWQPTLGFNPYKIYMQDNQDNWNMISGNITVITTTAPIIENLTEFEDPLELGNNFTINVDVDSNETFVDTVLIELDGINRTMINIFGNTYEYIYNSSEYIESGYSIGIPINYIIYANDSNNHWALPYQASFEIKDTIGPVLFALSESTEILELGDIEIISINCTDLAGINEVRIEFGLSNHSMINLEGDKWQYNWTPSSVGNNTYKIWGKDSNNNWNFISDSILVQDTTLPIYSDLTESANPVELGTPLTISINATDIATIKDVLIEYEGSNHSMDSIGGDIWQYEDWMPHSIGNYTYKIFITDKNDNLNYLVSSILFKDTVIPYYSNLYEKDDILELGEYQIIRIDSYDFAGINRTLLEFEGGNQSMTNILMTNTWEYNLWRPNDWTFYQYKIHIEDNSGNWNHLTGNFTVQDTHAPPLPVLTNSPSGDVSGILVFDWSDGIDPSGISFYILIISNETDPFATSGYIYFFNITNVGSESSYCELPEVLPPGRYYFFLAQVDGVGQQGSYTMGTFTVINNGTPWNNIFLIIGIVLASVIGSAASAIVLVRRRMKKKIVPSREKIPFKLISSHINRLSSPEFTPHEEEIQSVTGDKEIAIRINEIKQMGEELFAEGAYLEAQKQFKVGKDLLTHLGREEEAKLFSDLISGIEGLIEEREKRLEILEQVKNEGNSVQVFELYYEIIAISKKLRDPDTASFYQSELIQFFQINKLNLIDLEEYRNILEQKADSLLTNNQFEIAAQIYRKCEIISQIFIQLERDEEVTNFEKFRNKKTECLNRIKEKNSRFN